MYIIHTGTYPMILTMLYRCIKLLLIVGIVWGEHINLLMQMVLGQKESIITYNRFYLGYYDRVEMIVIIHCLRK